MNTCRSPLTGAEASLLFEHFVLGRHKAGYYYDPTVGYIFAGAPHWLNEAYSDAVAVTDTGILARNLGNINIISEVISREPHRFTRGVDIGGGLPVSSFVE